MQKRSNPFSVKRTVEEPVVEQNLAVEEEEEVVEVAPVQTAQTSYRRPQQRVVVAPQRSKFTATMEESLRREIKIYCAQNGVMFSTFIEDACKAYLGKGGRR